VDVVIAAFAAARQRSSCIMAAMSAVQGLDMVGDIAVFRPRASMPIDQAIWLVKSAIESAREQQIRKLLVVASGLEGFESPSIATRHMLAREWAGAAGGAVQIAVVAKPEMIDPQKFGVVVAAQFGALTNAFATEADAITWLRATP
jgi:hypothetical protein